MNGGYEFHFYAFVVEPRGMEMDGNRGCEQIVLVEGEEGKWGGGAGVQESAFHYHV